jgi:hypothetical protein
VANAVGRTAGSGERALSSGGSANERAAVRHVAEEAETGGFSKFGHSFTPGTKVVLASGAAVAISSLKVGDKVRSVDPKTEKSTVRMVAKVHVNHDSDLLDLTVMRNGHRAVMHTTARHPFWSQSRKAWVRADQLGTTDELKTDALKTDRTGVVRWRAWSRCRVFRPVGTSPSPPTTTTTSSAASSPCLSTTTMTAGQAKLPTSWSLEWGLLPVQGAVGCPVVGRGCRSRKRARMRFFSETRPVNSTGLLVAPTHSAQ